MAIFSLQSDVSISASAARNCKERRRRSRRRAAGLVPDRKSFTQAE